LRFHIAPEGTFECIVGVGSAKLFDHLLSAYAEDRIVGETGGVSDGLGDSSLAQTGAAEAQNVAVFGDEATAGKLLDHAGIQLGAYCEVKPIESLDRAEARAFEAALEASGLAGAHFGAKHLKAEVGEGRAVCLGPFEKSGQVVSEGCEVQIDSQLG
jgi:hypothetical protein